MFAKLFLFALPALAAPALKRTDGDITYYHPSTGTSACNQNHGDDDMVVALGASLFDSESLCGKTIKLQGDAGEITVTVADRCEGCQPDDLDVSPAAFKKAIGPLTKGRGKGTWSFA
ncbi:hypothetical protein F53441_12927 [Fusarium austroafricanum]|uniref:RlpA-like protein double-psi beta-barrel domain-containing protein n=1 Tax=Fusarium austroafricanum TaxID=2364996 RepID=A0A8H4JUN2_9HYPO|nr:hypothetical protein F53441_12927 [Fusarium austroafricanum]